MSSVVTISAGIGTIVPSADAYPSQIFNVADKMLYRAKENGRKWIEYAGPRKAPGDAAMG